MTEPSTRNLSPREGRSTRELRHQARLIVDTGDGKGKSTAAFGLVLRAWAQGWPVGVFQFVKSGAWRTGERAALEELDRVHRETGRGGPIEWQQLGAGFTWIRATEGVDHAELARRGWEEVCRRLTEQRHTLYVLDEFAHVLARGYVDPAEAAATLARRPGHQHVVVTGRGCPDEVLAVADIVTEMRKVKHPFDLGEPGQAGIEW